MKTVYVAVSAFVLASGIAASPTLAMPRLDPGATATTTPTVEKARLVCNYRRCYRVGGYRYYRPYYYRPYGYYRPHLGIGIGPLGVGIY